MSGQTIKNPAEVDSIERERSERELDSTYHCGRSVGLSIGGQILREEATKHFEAERDDLARELRELSKRLYKLADHEQEKADNKEAEGQDER